MNVPGRTLFCLAWLAAMSAPALAQPKELDPERKYVEFQIDKNAAEMIKNRLKLEKDLGPFKEIIEQLRNNPERMNGDVLKKIQGIKLEDENLKQAISDMMQHDATLQQDLEKWIEQARTRKNPPKVKRSLDELERVLKKTEAPRPQKITSIKKALAAKPKQDANDEASLAKKAEQLMKKVENSDLHDWLRDSPAWQRAYSDLRTALENPQAGNWQAGDWPSKLLAPDGKAWKLGEKALAGIKDLPRPDLDGWKPTLSLPGLGKIPTPNFAMPSPPEVRTPSLPTVATWLVLAALCLLAGWQISRWSKRPGAVLDWTQRIGPWPVKPEAVTTRAELVKAFDYLAILTLGFDARSWNHQAVVRQWCADAAASAPSADALSRLYEQARYTDGPAELTPPQRDQARQALLQLAEGR